MSQLYPGYAPLTVILPGTGSPGVIVSSGAADPHGIWPTPLEMTGGDKRFAVNLMAAVESLTSRTNLIGQRMVDWYYGGNWSSWTSGVVLGNYVTINRTATSDNTTALFVASGATDSIGIESHGHGNGSGIESIGGATGIGIKGTGGASGGPGIVGISQTTAFSGVVGTGFGTGSGGYFTPGATAGTPAVLAHNGPVNVDTNTSTFSADPGVNRLHANSIPKAWGGRIVTDGAGSGSPGTGNATVADGLNIAVTVQTTTGGGGHVIAVSFARAMANVNYSVTYGASAGGGGSGSVSGGGLFFPHTQDTSKTVNGFNIIVSNGSTWINLDTTQVSVDVQIMGKM